MACVQLSVHLVPDTRVKQRCGFGNRGPTTLFGLELQMSFEFVVRMLADYLPHVIRRHM